jgi:hypothetical protein
VIEIVEPGRLVVEALPWQAFAVSAGLPQALVKKAMDSDPDSRGAVPFLPWIPSGRRRLIRVEAGRRWLASLETPAA